MLVAIINNAMDCISNLSTHHKVRTHGNTLHVGNPINNHHVHGIVALVNRENVACDRHTRDNKGHFLIVRDNVNGLFTLTFVA